MPQKTSSPWQLKDAPAAAAASSSVTAAAASSSVTAAADLQAAACWSPATEHPDSALTFGVNVDSEHCRGV
jgi:hypothetical protein